jgi:phosphatidylglycerol---prolipoprotein diacylglyceryl transferase
LLRDGNRFADKDMRNLTTPEWRRRRSAARRQTLDATLPLPHHRCGPFSQGTDSMPLSVLPYPNFKPVLVKIGPFAIRWYALAYICGILLGWLYARRIIANESRWGGPPPFTVTDYDDFVLWVTLGIILGGRIGYVLFYNFSDYLAHPIEIVKVWNGGMSFHGGFLGCVAAVILFCRLNDIPILSLGDITTAVGPIGLFLGRLANFINSELWGRPADPSLPWAMIFPNGGPLPRHPSQLYEAGLEGILLFAILAVMIRFGALKRPGLILGSFIAIYGVARIIGEHFREPDPQLGFLWGGLTMGMLLSVPMVIVGAIIIVMALRRQAPTQIVKSVADS